MKKGLILLLTITTFLSCGVDLDILENTASIIPDDGFNILLQFPENDSEITEGIIVSSTESELIFKWSDKDDSNNSPYTVYLINNSNNDTIAYESLEKESIIVIQRDESYSWFVTGVSDSESDTWSFYNAGPIVDLSIPLPATAISPVTGASISQTSTTVNLIWKSEDADDDIIAHDLYFGETEDPEIYAEDITGTRFNDIPVEAGKVYYWKVITKDSAENESISPIFTFSVG